MSNAAARTSEPHRFAPPAGTERMDEEESLKLLAPRFEAQPVPWRQIAGYAGSLLLTFAALWATVDRLMPPAGLVILILALALVQALWQLGCFMHLRESRGPTWHLVTLLLGTGIGLGIVGFSIWIMTFKSGVS